MNAENKKRNLAVTLELISFCRPPTSGAQICHQAAKRVRLRGAEREIHLSRDRDRGTDPVLVTQQSGATAVR